MRLLKFLFWIVVMTGIQQQGLGANRTWTGATSSDWGTAGNWSGGIVPLATDNVIIVSAGNTPLLDAGRSITAFTLTSGSLNLNGFTLTIIGNATFTAGTITNGTLSISNTTTVFGNNAGGPVISANIASTSSSITFRNTTFNGSAQFTKTGAANDQCVGANTFNGSFSYTHNGTGFCRLSSTAGDVFNSSATYSQTNTGVLQPARNGTSTYNGDISVGGTSAITFGAGTGIVQVSGSSAQNFNNTGAQTPVINRLNISKSSGNLSINTRIDISTTLTLTSGNIISSGAANYIVLYNGSSCIGASNSSYVKGPVQKIGNTAFTFPVGEGGYYRPISISNPSVATDSYTAEFIKSSPDASYPTSSKDVNIDHVSQCEYWIINPSPGSSNVFVTLSWDTPVSCGVDNYTDLTVCQWDGLKWTNFGGSAHSGNNTFGTLQSTLSITSLSPVTLGSVTVSNPLPVELLYFNVVKKDNSAELTWSTATETNNDYFNVEKSLDGIHFQTFCQIDGAGNSNSLRSYKAVDADPYAGISYYRLKQVDYNGDFEYSDIRSLEFSMPDNGISLFPNPATNGISVSFPVSGPTTLRILDITGKCLYVHDVDNSGSQFVDLSGFASGVYFMQVNYGNKLEMKRFVKE